VPALLHKLSVPARAGEEDQKAGWAVADLYEWGSTGGMGRAERGRGWQVAVVGYADLAYACYGAANKRYMGFKLAVFTSKKNR